MSVRYFLPGCIVNSRSVFERGSISDQDIRNREIEATRIALAAEGVHGGDMISVENVGRVFLPDVLVQKYFPHEIIFEVVGPPNAGKTESVEAVASRFSPPLNRRPENISRAREMTRHIEDESERSSMMEHFKQAWSINVTRERLFSADDLGPMMPSICERRYYDALIWRRKLTIEDKCSISMMELDIQGMMRCIVPEEMIWVVILCLTPPECYFQRRGYKFSEEEIRALYHQYVRFYHEVVNGLIPNRNFVFGLLDFRGSRGKNADSLERMIRSVLDKVSVTQYI